MKKLQLFLFGLTAWLNSGAQNVLVPPVVPNVYTGMDLVTRTNPYLLIQEADENNPGNWINAQRSTYMLSQVPGYTSQVKNEFWENNEWVESYLQTDSFILDAQNRFDLAFENTVYNYPGFVYRMKLKYKYDYDQNGKVVQIDMKSANPPTSENYSDYALYKYFYDGSGRRILDTLIYTQASAPYRVHYTYDASGQAIDELWLVSNPSQPVDSFIRRTFAYENGHLSAETSQSYDEDNEVWFYQSADTLTYNAQGRVSGRITWGMVSINGSDFEFAPIRNESYTYTSSGMLEELIRLRWLNNEWVKENKINLFYDSAGAAILGLGYDANGGSWLTVPTSRILFKEFVGLAEAKGSNPEVVLYPVPAHDKIQILSKTALQNQALITDMAGKQMHVQLEHSGNHQYQVSVNLPSGLYLLNLMTQDGFAQQVKMVVE